MSREDGDDGAFWSRITAASRSASPLLSPTIVRGLCAMEASKIEAGDAAFRAYGELLEECRKRGLIDASEIGAFELAGAKAAICRRRA